MNKYNALHSMIIILGIIYFLSMTIIAMQLLVTNDAILSWDILKKYSANQIIGSVFMMGIQSFLIGISLTIAAQETKKKYKNDIKELS